MYRHNTFRHKEELAEQRESNRKQREQMKITKEQVLEILLKHSRNSGDYVPDYNFEKVAEEISNLSK